MNLEIRTRQAADGLLELPCACGSLRRVTRVVTRLYDQELRKAGVEITQFGLLTALDHAGEVNQKWLSGVFAMDSTTLTRTLGLLRKRGWIRARSGSDKRERLFSLTATGKRQLADAQPHWERAQRRLREDLGDGGWRAMKEAISRMTEAVMTA